MSHRPQQNEIDVLGTGKGELLLLLTTPKYLTTSQPSLRPTWNYGGAQGLDPESDDQHEDVRITSI